MMREDERKRNQKSQPFLGKRMVCIVKPSAQLTTK